MGNEADYTKTPSTSVEASPKGRLAKTNTSASTNAGTIATTSVVRKSEAHIKTEERITMPTKMKKQKNEPQACPQSWSQNHWRASFRTAHGCRKRDNRPFNKKQTQQAQEKTMQIYQANNLCTPRRLDTCTDRDCTQAIRQLIANPSVAKSK